MEMDRAAPVGPPAAPPPRRAMMLALLVPWLVVLAWVSHAGPLEEERSPATPGAVGVERAATDAAGAARAEASSPVASRPTFSRVGLIGASATAGFGVRLDATAPDGVSKEIHGADLGDLMLAASSEPMIVSRLGSMWFFNDPVNIGRGQIDRLLRFDPTCVLGVDFLFWYGYGSRNLRGERMRNEDERLELLEEGLRQLDRAVELGVPVVVGDFPDMRGAIGRMLSPAQVPAPETIARLNARVAEWVAARPTVRLLPLSSLVPRLDEGEEVVIRGRTWSKSKDGPSVQRDRLHPTFIGALALAAAATEMAETCAPDGVCGTLSFDPDLVVPRFLEQVRAGRQRSGQSPVSTPPPPPAAPAAPPEPESAAPRG